MIAMRTVRHLVAMAALVAATTSCGSVVREGRSPVYLVIALLQAAQGNHISSFGGSLTSDVLTLVTSPDPCSTASPCRTIFNDVGHVDLRISLKDIGTLNTPTTPTTNNEVTITRYHVAYRRADGRNTPGVDVPYPFDGAATGTVGAGNTLGLSFEIVRHIAKEESPLVELVISRVIITTIADVTFYGVDQAGNQLSVTGSITVDFGNFGD
jgi:hypothetical protein